MVEERVLGDPSYLANQTQTLSGPVLGGAFRKILDTGALREVLRENNSFKVFFLS